MRKIYLLFSLLGMGVLQLHSQLPMVFCDKTASKVSYSGRAPWAIDGELTDWQTLLGPPVTGSYLPFHPPQSSAFNWAGDNKTGGPSSMDGDQPPPDRDINFLSFMHDDYNVYFYLHRMGNSNAPNTFFYFMDVNADGFMNTGEPVFHANMSSSGATSLTVSQYIANKNEHYVAGKGNYMTSYYDPVIQMNFPWVDNFPMVGSLQVMFDEGSIPSYQKLRSNEVFDVKITENGLGVELAIPWRYLRYYSENALADRLLSFLYQRPGSIFFYHVSMQNGTSPYVYTNVADNAGSCCGGIGKSGNVNLSKKVTTTVLEPGLHYQVKVEYRNLTNAAEKINIEQFDFNNLRYQPDQAAPGQGVIVNIYPDKNANGIVDIGEEAVLYNFYDFGDGNVRSRPVAYKTAEVVAYPFWKAGFIVDLRFPPTSALAGTDFEFRSSVLFNIIQELCDEAGGKQINTVGVIGGSLSDEPMETIRPSKKMQLEEQPSTKDYMVYPNPSKGTVFIDIPQGNAEIEVLDNLGRTVRKLRSAGNLAKLSKLNPGFYTIRIRVLATNELILKKLVVQ
jgi:hypothetical protein